MLLHEKLIENGQLNHLQRNPLKVLKKELNSAPLEPKYLNKRFTL